MGLYQKALAIHNKDLNKAKSQAWRHMPVISGWEVQTGGSWEPHSQCMSQGKWQGWKFGGERAYYRGIGMLGLLRKDLVRGALFMTKLCATGR